MRGDKITGLTCVTPTTCKRTYTTCCAATNTTQNSAFTHRFTNILTLRGCHKTVNTRASYRAL
jgi:hypothetical protein